MENSIDAKNRLRETQHEVIATGLWFENQVKNTPKSEYYQLPDSLESLRVPLLKFHSDAFDAIHLHNGHTYRLCQVDATNKYLNLVVQPSRYFDTLLTNYSSKLKVGKRKVKDMLSDSSVALHLSEWGNSLSINLLLQTLDNHIIIQERSDFTMVDRGKFTTSVSGVAKEHHKPVGPFTTAYAQSHEELNLDRTDFTSLKITSITRDRKRGYKPHINMIGYLRLTADDIFEKTRDAQDLWEHNSTLQVNIWDLKEFIQQNQDNITDQLIITYLDLFRIRMTTRIILK